MTDSLTVYRTRHAKAFAAFDDAERALAAWRERVKAVQTLLGMEGREARYNDFHGRVAGFSHREGDPVPFGWRVAEQGNVIVPRLNTKIGRSAAAELALCKRPDPREQLPGMPRECLVPGRLLRCGLRRMQGEVYVTWSAPIPEQLVDLDVWERVRLSAYYAAVEAEQEREAADG